MSTIQQAITRHVGLAAGMVRRANEVDEGLPHLLRDITFGSFTLEPRDGNPEPNFWFNEETYSSINAIGLKNFGLRHFLEEFWGIAMIRQYGCNVRLSLAPLKTGDLTKMITLLNKAGVADSISELEINAACPNHRSDDGVLHPVLSHDIVALEALMAEAETYKGPKAIKIAPLMGMADLKKCIELCLKYKFRHIVSGNTLLGSSTIDGAKRLSVENGGLAGKALFADALHQVERLEKLRNYLKIDKSHLSIIGCGGIMSADDVKAYLAAGAESVQVATLFYQFGAKAVRDLVTELV
jgi:dihydroorotate dehydrogenase